MVIQSTVNRSDFEVYPEVKKSVVIFFLDELKEQKWPVTHTPYGFAYAATLLGGSGGPVGEVYLADNFACDAVVLQRGFIPARKLTFHSSPFAHYSNPNDAEPAEADCFSAGKLEWFDVRQFSSEELGIVYLRENEDLLEKARIFEQLDLLHKLEDAGYAKWFIKPSMLRDIPSSKAIPELIGGIHYPKTMNTASCGTGTGLSDKLGLVSCFVKEVLGDPDNFIAKPANRDNGTGITLFGKEISSGADVVSYAETEQKISDMIGEYGDIVVQEYLPSVRNSGEVRFILINGKLPRKEDGTLYDMAVRRPAEDSILTDSGVSASTQLTPEEAAFCEDVVGYHYRKWGVFYGGGDLIRTQDGGFYFTDAAAEMCGHLIVTGKLNDSNDVYCLAKDVLEAWLNS